jgi:hypothetical protein
MTLLPEIRGQLLDAAFGSAQTQAGAARRPRSGRLAIAFSIVTSAAVAAVFLVGLHGSAAPPSGAAARPAAGPPPVAWLKALGKAGSSTRQHDRACRLPLQVRVRNQKLLSTAPPRSITAILPSLASPARGALRVTDRKLRALQIVANGIYARYAWQGHTDGVHYYVVPAAVVGTTKTLPARCYREALAAFRAEARHFPASEHAAAIAYARRRISPQAEAGVAVITVGGGGRGGRYIQAWRLAELNANPAGGSGGGGTNNSTKPTLLVTREVGSVTATYPAQSYPGRVPRTFSVTTRPVRNLVIFHLIGAWDPPQLTFRSRTGAVIARTHNR